MVQGTFCPMGSAHPRKCPALAACPTGSAAPGFNAGAFLMIILVILAYLGVYLTARHLLRKRASRKRQERSARSQVGHASTPPPWHQAGCVPSRYCFSVRCPERFALCFQANRAGRQSSPVAGCPPSSAKVPLKTCRG